MKFLTGLCQDDVTTSSGDVTSRNKLHSHVRKKVLRKVTKGILEICYGSGVTQLKIESIVYHVLSQLRWRYPVAIGFNLMPIGAARLPSPGKS